MGWVRHFLLWGACFCLDGGVDGKITIWDLKTQALASTLEIPDNNKPVTSLAFSENGYHFASTHTDTLGVWDLRKLKLLTSLDTPTELSCVTFDPSGKYLAYGGQDGVTIIVVKDWEKKVVTLPVEKGVTAVDWDEEGVVTVGEDRFVRFWKEEEVKEEGKEEEKMEVETNVKEEKQEEEVEKEVKEEKKDEKEVKKEG